MVNLSYETPWQEYNQWAARGMAFQGFPVFPCHARNKTPALPGNWRETPWRRSQDIEALWAEPFRDFLPAVLLEHFRLLVVDPDVKGKHNGLEAWGALCAEHGLPDGVPVVTTPSGGRHYYFKIPDELHFGNGRGTLPPGIGGASRKM